MKTVYTLPKSRILLLLFVLTLTAFSGAFSVSAQTTGDYGSLSSGSWVSTTTWGRWTGSAYVNDGTYPGQTLITPAPAVTIQAGHTVTANFNAITPTSTITYNVSGKGSVTAYITPNPIGKLTINIGGKLILPTKMTTYINTPQINVLSTQPSSSTYTYPTNTGQIEFTSQANLALPANAELYAYYGGLTGAAGNVDIYIGSLWYAVGTSNSATFNFAELMAAGGPINAEITSNIITPICLNSSVPLQGKFTGAFRYTTSANNVGGVTYEWYDNNTLISTTTYQLATGTITNVNTNHTSFNYTPTTVGTHVLKFRVITWLNTTNWVDSFEERTVIVRPTPTATIGGTATVCQNTTSPNITFTNPQTLPVTVTYNINGGSETTISVPAKVNTTNGIATVSVPTNTAGTFTYTIVSVQYQTDPTCINNNIIEQTATVIVNPATTITAQPQSQTVCPATNNVSLSVAATGTGTLTYQWYKDNSEISGATSASYTTTINDFGTYYYYCKVTGTCGVIDSNVATITVSNTATTWTGNTNTNWNDANNWTCGIPIATSNVTIPAGKTFYPVVEISTAVCNTLTIADGATLIINPGMLLTVGGTITGAGTAAQAGKIRVKASPNGTTANGSLIINCDNNSTIIGGVRNLNKIYGTVEFYTKALKDENAATWTDVIPGSPTNGVTFNTKYKWQFFGVPVKEVVANPTFYGSFLRKYREDLNDPTTAKWDVLNNASKLEAFEGYEITQAAAKMIEIAGELQFCDKILTLTRLAPETTGGIHFGLGQNIFGNSYTAAIKISQMTMPATVDQTVYLYNTGSLADWYAAGLITSPANNATMTAGSYISIPKNVSGEVWDEIPSMQGFLLKYLPEFTTFQATPNAEVILKYANGGVVGNTKPQLAPKAAEEPLSYLRVNLQSASTVDNLWLFSREGTSSNFDNGWDGHKHFGTPTAFIYSMTPDGPMQVNTDRTIDGSVINFYANEDTEYTLTLVKSNLDQYSDLKLIDFETKTVTPLTAELTRYNFSSTTTRTVEKRFMIVNSASKIDFKKYDFNLLYGYLSADKTLIVTNFSGEPGTMTLSTASGVIVMNKPLTTGTSHFPTSLKAGAYVLTMQAGANKISIKVLVNNK